MLKMVTRGVSGMGYCGSAYGYWDLTGGGKMTTLTGTGTLTLPDSAGKRLQLELRGNSEQGSTTGAQLLPLMDMPDGEAVGVRYWMEEGCLVLDGISTSGTGAQNDLYFTGGSNVYEDAGFPAGAICVCAYEIPKGISLYIVRNSDKTVVSMLTSVLRESAFTHADGEKYRIMLRVSGAGIVLSREKVRVMVNAGTLALPWEPYTGGRPSPDPDYPQEIRSAGSQTADGCMVRIRISGPAHEQTASIYTGEPLRGVGAYRDRICKKDGIWGVERNAAERVFDGGAQIEENGGCQNGVFRAKCKFEEARGGADVPGICDKLRKGGGGTERFQLRDQQVYLYINAGRLKGDGSVPDGLRQWLSENPLTVAAPVETPVWEPLDEAAQAALNALAAQKGTTVITADSGEIPVEITAAYRKGR